MHSVPRPRSFFLKFLLITALVGNLYLFFEFCFHSLGVHILDDYLRWYAFKAAWYFHLVSLLGVAITLFTVIKLVQHRFSVFRFYLIGKLITTMGYVLLTYMEYKLSGLSYPPIVPFLILFIESVYPLLLYLSLRKLK